MPDDPATPALDIEQPASLEAYLRAAGWLASGVPLHHRVLVGGVSNKTVWVQLGDEGPRWVLKQALPKLRTAIDWYSDPARINREAEGLAWLGKHLPPRHVTPLVFTDPQQHLLAMQAAPEPHDNWKSLLLAGQLDLAHVTQFADILSTIHRAGATDSRAANRFADRSFFESLRLEPYYGYAAEQTPEAAPFLHQLITDTRACRMTVVHGDYSPKNVLVHAGNLILLDHEVIHFGDPAFDVGFAMTHLLSKAHHLAPHRAAFAEAARTLWRQYQQGVSQLPWDGAKLEAAAIAHTLGCMLARVRGRSRLEYLSESARDRQAAIVISLTRNQPPTIDDLVTRFIAELSYA